MNNQCIASNQNALKYMWFLWRKMIWFLWRKMIRGGFLNSVSMHMLNRFYCNILKGFSDVRAAQ